jgi:hypothetical protein
VKHNAVERRQRAGRGEQRFGAGALPGHDNLRGAQSQIDGVEQRHVHVEIFDRLRRDGRDQPIGFLPPGIVAREQREADQVLRGDCVVVGRCLVRGGGWADHKTFGIGSGEIIRSRFHIRIIAIKGALPDQRLIKIALLAGGLVERQ